VARTRRSRHNFEFLLWCIVVAEFCFNFLLNRDLLDDSLGDTEPNWGSAVNYLNGFFSFFLLFLVKLEFASMAVQLSEKAVVVKGHDECFIRAKELIEKFNLPGASQFLIPVSCSLDSITVLLRTSIQIISGFCCCRKIQLHFHRSS
jgi:hypothetical protein